MKTKTPLLFDLDGTLWDTRQKIADSWNNTLEREGLSRRVALENLSPLLGKTMDAFRKFYLAELPIQEAEAIMAKLETQEVIDLQSGCQSCIYDHVISTLKELAKEHYIGIVSNCQIGYIEDFIANANLEDVIDGHLCYGETLESKDKTIQALMARENLEKAIYIGDTNGDKQAAMDAGIPFIWVKYGFGEQVEPKGINDFEELLSMEY